MLYHFESLNSVGSNILTNFLILSQDEVFEEDEYTEAEKIESTIPTNVVSEKQIEQQPLVTSTTIDNLPNNNTQEAPVLNGNHSDEPEKLDNEQIDGGLISKAAPQQATVASVVQPAGDEWTPPTPSAPAAPKGELAAPQNAEPTAASPTPSTWASRAAAANAKAAQTNLSPVAVVKPQEPAAVVPSAPSPVVPEINNTESLLEKPPSGQPREQRPPQQQRGPRPANKGQPREPQRETTPGNAGESEGSVIGDDKNDFYSRKPNTFPDEQQVRTSFVIYLSPLKIVMIYHFAVPLAVRPSHG